MIDPVPQVPLNEQNTPWWKRWFNNLLDNVLTTSSSIEDLSDVASMTPTNGQVLTWNSTGEEWEAQTSSGGVTASGTPVDNQIAVWTSASAIEGDSNFTWDGTTLTVADTEILSGSITLTGVSSSGITLIQSGATTDNKNWSMSVQSESLSIGVISDDYLSSDTSITINRSGVSTSSVQIDAPVQIQSNLDFVSSATSIDLVSGNLEYTVNSTLTARMRDTEFNVLGDVLSVGQNDLNDGRIVVYGDNLTQGARIFLYNGAGSDTVVNRYEIEATAGTLDFLQDSTAIAELGSNGSFFIRRDFVIDEAADHAETPTAGQGQFWVRNDTPNTPVFTDDAGTDHVIKNRDVFCNASGGAPVANTTAFAVDGLTASTWTEVNSTNWTALGDVPEHADWIEIKCYCECINSSPSVGDNLNVIVGVRDDGSTATGNATTILYADSEAATTGSCFATGVATHKVPVTYSSGSARFEIVYTTVNTTTDDIEIYLCGWGVNAA